MHDEGSLEWKLDRTDQGFRLELSGDIDEHGSSLLKAIVKQVSDTVVIDTQGVRRINSPGVRNWVEFMRALASLEVRLVRCSPAVVLQLNSVYNFRGHAQVESVLAPFFCSRCDREQLEAVMIPATRTAPSALIEGLHVCAECGQSLAFDDIPERFFMFLE